MSLMKEAYIASLGLYSKVMQLNAGKFLFAFNIAKLMVRPKLTFRI
jgi:hypothetical protein